MQQLWLTQLKWDDVLNSDLYSQWKAFSEELPIINNIRIPRHIMCQAPAKIDLHGFADASQKAYGACIYLRSISSGGNVSCNLLCAKTKVAPLKLLTIPKLELSAAVVLTKLMEKVKVALDIKIDSITYWTDSQIVLSWLKSEPYRLNTYVANRVVLIQSFTSITQWQYVSTHENPSDLLSRGVKPSKVATLKLWWHGPVFLLLNKTKWPLTVETINNIPELKPSTLSSTLQASAVKFLFDKFSSFLKMQKVAAYVLRFIENCKKSKEFKQKSPLSINDLNKSRYLLLRLSQRESFLKEYHILKNGKTLSSKSKIFSLSPFFDKENDIIRVGGRLSQSNFSYDKKYPILLSAKHHLTNVIFLYEHKRLMHAGVQLLLSHIKETYWPLGARSLAKKIIYNCVQCFRAKPRETSNIMGNLPSDRIKPISPFSIVGTDFAGPFLLKDKKGRGAKITKCYFCLFICFVTKACHLELVSDLSTDAFILALRRFASRRGMPSKIYSDNAKNYVGANNKLKELGKFLINNDNLEKALVNEGVNWIFLPSYSPHLGGIWESCVKSIKYHLNRVMNNISFTFEQMSTILTQIEAILNSRPLYPASEDPNDLNPITPSHFLMGKVITSVPDPNLMHIPENRLDVYQHSQVIVQHLWSRWSKEYICNLQRRNKWQKLIENIAINSMVILKDENLPPTKWRLGRIVQLHAGSDGVVRVVTIRTASGLTRRTITKVCVLPNKQLC